MEEVVSKSNPESGSLSAPFPERAVSEPAIEGIVPEPDPVEVVSKSAAERTVQEPAPEKTS